MKDWKSLSHVKWECKYHIVFVSKYRHKTIYGKIREKIGGIIRDSGYAVHSSRPPVGVVVIDLESQWIVLTGAKCITR